jgi:hypothetical protein
MPSKIYTIDTKAISYLSTEGKRKRKHLIILKGDSILGVRTPFIPFPEIIFASEKEIYMKQTKECSKCHALKPLNEFSSNGLTSKGKQKYKGPCKVCEAARHRKLRRGSPHLARTTKCFKCTYEVKYMIRTVDEDGLFYFICEDCRKKLNKQRRSK